MAEDQEYVPREWTWLKNSVILLLVTQSKEVDSRLINSNTHYPKASSHKFWLSPGCITAKSTKDKNFTQMSGLLQDSTGFVFLSNKNKQKWGVKMTKEITKSIVSEWRGSWCKNKTNEIWLFEFKYQFRLAFGSCLHAVIKQIISTLLFQSGQPR